MLRDDKDVRPFKIRPTPVAVGFQGRVWPFQGRFLLPQAMLWHALQNNFMLDASAILAC